MSAVGVDGGDIWSGTRVDKARLDETVTTATSTSPGLPIIAQYYPGRLWLWKQWRQTIVRRVLPDVLGNIAIAVSAALLLRPDGSSWRFARTESCLAGVAKVWSLSATLVTFTLSFFLSQSYTLWRSVYSVTRRVQGRLNDIGLLAATYAQRNATTGTYTPSAEALLTTVARYVRLWNYLFYASVTTRFAPLATPQGLTALVEAGALTSEEREGLLASSMGHNAVISWLAITFDSAIADGRLGVSVARQGGSSPIAVQMALENKLVELRATYASLPDELSGRMPLAYVNLVQLLSDGLILATPFALVHSVGGLTGIALGTAVITLFHASIVNLAKTFLDPLNNEAEQRGGDRSIGGIEVATLLQQTNVGSERWRKSSSWVPKAALQVAPPEKGAPKADAPEQEQGLIGRIFGIPEARGSQPGETDDSRLEDSDDAGAAAEANAAAADEGVSAAADV